MHMCLYVCACAVVGATPLSFFQTWARKTIHACANLERTHAETQSWWITVCVSVGKRGDKEGSNNCTVPGSWTTKCDATYLLWPVLRKWGNEALSLSADMTDILWHFSSLTWTGVRSPRAVTLGLRTGDVNVLAASSSRGESLDPGP